MAPRAKIPFLSSSGYWGREEKERRKEKSGGEAASLCLRAPPERLKGNERSWRARDLGIPKIATEGMPDALR